MFILCWIRLQVRRAAKMLKSWLSRHCRVPRLTNKLIYVCEHRGALILYCCLNFKKNVLWLFILQILKPRVSAHFFFVSSFISSSMTLHLCRSFFLNGRGEDVSRSSVSSCCRLALKAGVETWYLFSWSTKQKRKTKKGANEFTRGAERKQRKKVIHKKAK